MEELVDSGTTVDGHPCPPPLNTRPLIPTGDPRAATRAPSSATQAAEHHAPAPSPDHVAVRSAAINARDLVGSQNARQATHRTNQRLPAAVTTTAPRRHPARHRVRLQPQDIAAGDHNIAVNAINAYRSRQPAGDRRRRQARPAVGYPRHVSSPAPLEPFAVAVMTRAHPSPGHRLGPLPTTAKNVFKSWASGATVFGRARLCRPPIQTQQHRPADDRRTNPTPAPPSSPSLPTTRLNLPNLHDRNHGNPPRSSSADEETPGRSVPGWITPL